jgi:hypothetical protein
MASIAAASRSNSVSSAYVAPSAVGTPGPRRMIHRLKRGSSHGASDA